MVSVPAGGRRPKLQRIGLSATVKPIEEIARLPSETPHIVSVGHRRDMALAIEVPKDETGPAASNEMWGEVCDRVEDLIRTHRTTLVFDNTRRLSKRVAHQLAERLGEQAVLPHRGSLSRCEWGWPLGLRVRRGLFAPSVCGRPQEYHRSRKLRQ